MAFDSALGSRITVRHPIMLTAVTPLLLQISTYEHRFPEVIWYAQTLRPHWSAGALSDGQPIALPASPLFAGHPRGGVYPEPSVRANRTGTTTEEGIRRPSLVAGANRAFSTAERAAESRAL